MATTIPITADRLIFMVKPKVRVMIWRLSVAGGASPGAIPFTKTLYIRLLCDMTLPRASPRTLPIRAPTTIMSMK